MNCILEGDGSVISRETWEGAFSHTNSYQETDVSYQILHLNGEEFLIVDSRPVLCTSCSTLD